MMRGITFTDITSGESRHTGDDWYLIMSEKKIGMPAPRIKKVDMTDRDGELDLSEATLGRVSYTNRTLSFTFIHTDGYENRNYILSEITQFIHGKRLKIVDPDTPGWHYIGRCTVHEPSYIGEMIMFIPVTVDADPYRLYDTLTTVATNMQPGYSLWAHVPLMPVVPTITLGAAMTIQYGDRSFALAAGTHVIDDLVLGQGSHEFIVTAGSGKLKITFQRGTI